MPTTEPSRPRDPSEPTGFPPLNEGEDELPTRRMSLDELPSPHQLEASLEVIRLHHPHIARAIDALWGYAECEQYLNRLVFDGHDERAHTRAGFRPEVLTALMRLQGLHVITAR